MAPRRKSAASAKPSRSGQGSLDVDVSQMEKVNLSDANALKHALDTVAHKVVTDTGYEEDHLISNVKIALGLLAISCALYAQFGPGKFPSNWWAQCYCVMAYLVTTVVLNLFCYMKEGDSFLITHPKQGYEFGIRVSTHMERFSDQYVLVISSSDKLQRREVRFPTSVTEYFHADGYLAEHNFRTDVEKLLQQYEQEDFKKTH